MKIFLMLIFIILTQVGCSTIKESGDVESQKPLDVSNNISNQCFVSKNSNKTRKRRLLKVIKKFLPNKNSKKISVSFLDTSIKEALIELSSVSGIPIMFDENVSGLTSLSVENKPIEKVLRMLTFSGPYDFRKIGRFYYFGVLDPELNSWQKLSMNEKYKTQYVSPKIILDSLDSSLQKHVQIDIAHRSINISAPRSLMLKIFKNIYKLDKPQKQIVLKLTMIELNKGKINKLGKDLKTGGLSDFIPDINSVSNLVNPIILPSFQFKHFLFSMKALKKRGIAEIKAQPSMITREGTPAHFSSKNRTLLASTNDLANSKLNFIESGIVFQIIPYIGNKNEIHIKIIDSTASHYDEEKRVISEHKIAAELIVKEGQSIILGGMMHKDHELIVTKVPLVSSIPILGNFFKSKNKREVTKEVLFAIQPTVLCGT